MSDDPWDRDWEWAGRFAARLTTDWGTWDQQVASELWPVPFTVERVSLVGDGVPRQVLIEYFGESGFFGYRETFADDDIGQAADDADLTLMNLGSVSPSGRTWRDGDRTWWTHDET